MPRQVTEFRVVVASPSDVLEARKAVFDVIHELNRAFEIQKVSIRGLGWEEYAIPGAGSEAQDVINDQLLREYDILIALFGTKLGTPTLTSASGTVEEIEHAITNGDSAAGKHRVQVYFLDRIESLSSVSLEEMKRVADYRKSLEARGILYRTFKSERELQQEIRVNLQRPIMDYLRRDPAQVTEQIPSGEAKVRSVAPPESQHVDDAGGLLDQQETAEEAIEAATVAINQIGALIQEIGAETDRQVAEFQKGSFFSLPAREKKKAVNAFASFLETKANRLKQAAQIGRENFNRYAAALIAVASIERESSDPSQYRQNVSLLLESVETILTAMPENRRATTGFKSAIENLPRITIQFNQSKRLLVEALDECLQLFEETERGIFEIAGKT